MQAWHTKKIGFSEIGRACKSATVYENTFLTITNVSFLLVFGSKVNKLVNILILASSTV